MDGPASPPTLPPSPGPPPGSPPDYVTWCEPTNVDVYGTPLHGPCLVGLAWWIWLLLLLCVVACLCRCCCCCARMARAGKTPSIGLRSFEATFTAAHSYPWKSKAHGSSWPLLDLLEAQACCCCLPVSVGVALIGLVDLGRVVNALIYAIDGLVIYPHTDSARFVGELNGLMQPDALRFVEPLLWGSVAISSATAALWVLTALSLCCGASLFLQLLLVWLPIDAIHSIVFATLHVRFARDLCVVDLDIYQATGRVGYRREYLHSVKTPPYMLGDDGVPEWCNAFQRQEVGVAVGDVLGAFLVLISGVYYGGSLLRARLREDQMVGGGRTYAGGLPHRV